MYKKYAIAIQSAPFHKKGKIARMIQLIYERAESFDSPEYKLALYFNPSYCRVATSGTYYSHYDIWNDMLDFFKKWGYKNKVVDTCQAELALYEKGIRPYNLDV